MLTAFLHETFRLFGGALGARPLDAAADSQLGASLDQAVEHVVDETNSRLRALPGYGQRLRRPVEHAFRYIDELVESIPDPVFCSRSTFVSDPRVNAFFATPGQLQEVFSRSEEVRELFAAHAVAGDCWALLCMRKDERKQFGTALIDGELRREVMQTGVSFTDHQIVAPGLSDEEARRGLKCCIFNNLLSYVRRRGNTAKETVQEAENRLRVLRGRLQQKRAFAADAASVAEIEAQIERQERLLDLEDLRLDSLEDHLAFVAGVLRDPTQVVRRADRMLRLTRMGIKIESGPSQGANAIPLSEIHVACHEPRVAVLVRFPRAELLPEQDYLQRADLFLAV
jgi:hypothetical protein